MAEVIFQEIWWEPESVSICYITMSSILWNQVKVSDIVNESSVSFFYYILKYLAKKDSRLVVVQNKNHYLKCKKMMLKRSTRK